MKDSLENSCIIRLKNILCTNQKDEHFSELGKTIKKLVCEKNKKIIHSICRENMEDIVEKYREELRDYDGFFLFYIISQIFDVTNKMYRVKNYSAIKDVREVLKKYDPVSASMILDCILDSLTKYESRKKKKWCNLFGLIKDTSGEIKNLNEINNMIKVYERDDYINMIKKHTNDAIRAEIIKTIYNLYKNELAYKSNKQGENLSIISEYMNTLRIHDEIDVADIVDKISTASKWYKDNKIIRKILDGYKNR